ncbi:MAG: Crp/Fnr family transcriptional regulator [Alphaproteobacteria bacterium]
MPPARQTENQLLDSLSASDYDQLRAHLQTVDLAQGITLYATGDEIDRVYFPHSGVISLVVALGGGGMIEAAMVGKDSIFGASAALDGKISLSTAIIQLPVRGSTLEVSRLRAFTESNVSFRTSLIRHDQALFAQAQQSAACNALHTVEARLSRWLLRVRDLSGADDFTLTQEFLSQMLGVRRPSVSLVANTLQQAGLIRYRRGRIEITNLEGLREVSCECYEIVRAHYDRLLSTDRKAGRA